MYSGKRFLKKRFSLFTAAQFFTAKGVSLYAPHSFRSAAETKTKGAMIMDGQRLASWYDFYRTGEAQHFFALMNSLPASTGE